MLFFKKCVKYDFYLISIKISLLATWQICFFCHVADPLFTFDKKNIERFIYENLYNIYCEIEVGMWRKAHTSETRQKSRTNTNNFAETSNDEIPFASKDAHAHKTQ